METSATITSKYLKKSFSKFFQCFFLKNIVLTDPEYVNISLFDLEESLSEIIIPQDKTFECNDYARRMYYALREKFIHSPIGIVHLKKFNGENIRHACNIAFVKKHGVVLINPVHDIGAIAHGERQVRRPIKSKDIFTFIYI